MATFTRIDGLLTNAEKDLARLHEKGMQADLFSGMESVLFQLAGLMLKKYTEAELTPEQSKELSDIESRLTGYAEKLKADIASAQQATAESVAKLKASDKDYTAKLFALFSQQQATEASLTEASEQASQQDTEAKRGLENVKALAGLKAGYEMLDGDYTPDTGESEPEASKVEMGKEQWLIPDLLKTSDWKAVFHYDGPTRKLSVYPIGKNYASSFNGKAEQQKWYTLKEPASQAIKSLTVLQRACHYMLDTALTLSDGLDSAWEKSLKVAANTEPPFKGTKNSYNVGGTHAIYLVVDSLPDTRYKRAVLRSELHDSKHYGFPMPATSEPASEPEATAESEPAASE